MTEKELERILQEEPSEKEVDRAVREFLQSDPRRDAMGAYKAQEKYDAAHTKQVKLKLNTRTDADILDALQRCGNVQGYIKALIREDIRRRSGE